MSELDRDIEVLDATTLDALATVSATDRARIVRQAQQDDEQFGELVTAETINARDEEDA